MPREFNRTDRVADHIRREVAQLIQQSMRDPRVAMTSVTDVEVSRDLSHAKVFVTFLNVDKVTPNESFCRAISSTWAINAAPKPFF